MQAEIDSAKESAESAKDALLKTFAFVPDDRLRWSPSETARTPLWLVAHCGVSNQAFAKILRGEPLPLPKDPAEAAAFVRNGGRDVTSREEAIRLVEASTEEVIAALDAVTEERLRSRPDSPLGRLPFTVWMSVPGHHMRGHTHQLAYMQTIWGDVQDHA